MLTKDFVEEDYNKVKIRFQSGKSLQTAYKIADEMGEHNDVLRSVFSFLISVFDGKLRNDKKTPLVFHSIYLTKLLYMCGEKDIDSLLTVALHDVLEDTKVSEEMLTKENFMKDKGYLIKNLRILKENVNLSREPDGKNLPPRYAEHISRLIGSPREVINTEIVDRFSDLMDLEYITKLPKEEKELRLKSKLIKVKSFVENITRNRGDFNQICFKIFMDKVENLEKELKIKVKTQIINFPFY